MWKRCGVRRGRGLFLLFERGEKLFVCREALNSKSENYSPLRSRIFYGFIIPSFAEAGMLYARSYTHRLRKNMYNQSRITFPPFTQAASATARKNRLFSKYEIYRSSQKNLPFYFVLGSNHINSSILKKQTETEPRTLCKTRLRSPLMQREIYAMLIVTKRARWRR